jgi:hypothetical protein
MTHAQPIFAAPDADPTDPRAQRAAERFAMLRELADTGMEFTRALQRQLRVLTEAEADPGSAEATRSAAEVGLAFSRVARAVRQTLALEVKFEEGPKARNTVSDAEAAWRQEMVGAGERLRAKLAAMGFEPTRPQGYVQSGDADDEERPEDLADRPDDDDREGFSRDLPPGEVLAGVCADLGIERDLSVWADEDQADEGAPTGAAVSPDGGPADQPFSRREKEGPSEAGRMRGYGDSGPGP